MPDLSFSVVEAAAVPASLTPQLRFRLGIVEAAGEPIDTVALAIQIQIEATRRPYEPAEREALLDLFGAPAGWGRTLRTMLWTHANVVIPGFTGETVADLVIPCSYDLSLAAAKYFFALDDGEVPLVFQFSGSIFYRDVDDGLQAAPIPWTKETQFRLPVATWRGLMEEHYANQAWLSLRRDVFDRLYRHRARSGLPNWESVVEQLLDHEERSGGGEAGAELESRGSQRLFRSPAAP